MSNTSESAKAKKYDIVLIGHESIKDAEESAQVLSRLGASSYKLLADCVESTGVKRKQLSASAKALENAGFLFVRDIGNIWDVEFQLLPTLAGEEALLVLDEMREG